MSDFARSNEPAPPLDIQGASYVAQVLAALVHCHSCGALRALSGIFGSSCES